ncbi:hypothetical protein BD779DRAFT_1230764 [Infundibulicybe gibba]|nr:hypothetical protein BD779DRAFT_1230764 [Infundibulicybe gibba]
MFSGGTNNPYDDIVNKTTDENLTSENWELILNLCDKVDEDGSEGAHNVIAAVLKRLAHRNPNVQLYALSLAEALSKNCAIDLKREIASRAFTQGLEKLVTDRNTHEKVKRRALGLIAMWTDDFAHDSTLGVMEDCYNSLKAKNFKFEAAQEGVQVLQQLARVPQQQPRHHLAPNHPQQFQVQATTAHTPNPNTKLVMHLLGPLPR